jgi:transposase
MVAAKIATMVEGRPRETASIDAVSQPQAAEMLNVSVPSVQRAMVAAKIATMAEGRPSETRPIGLVSQDNAAEMLNVSTRSVKRAKAVQESGDASGFHARHHASLPKVGW